MKNNNLKPGDKLIMAGYLCTAFSVIIIYFTTDDIRLLILSAFVSLSVLAGMIINILSLLMKVLVEVEKSKFNTLINNTMQYISDTCNNENKDSKSKDEEKS
jgi:hypothetical protein|nr:MAG TPA: hypothetical protein [Caudoviricetes sp.]